jgi:ankyrin repeat protein
VKQNILFFFSLFFAFQSSAMFSDLIIPSDAVTCIMSNFDYKSNIQFIRTCKELYVRYADRNDILFTKHYLSSDDYTGAMVYFARKNDIKKIKLFIRYEGIFNKDNRENILDFFQINGIVDRQKIDDTIDYQQIIEIYKQEYDQNQNYHIGNINYLVGEYTPVLQLILKQGYNPNIKDLSGFPVLTCAAKEKNSNALKLLLADPASNGNIKDVTGFTALDWAVKENNIEFLRLLLADKRVDRDVESNNGFTALHRAVEKNNIDFLKLLVDNFHIDLNIKDVNGFTALHYAVIENNIKILRLLLTDPRVDPNVEDKYGSTALHEAVTKNIEALKILLADTRVDLSVKDKYGFTALHEAVDKNNIDALRLLLADKGVDLSIKTNNGLTAYDLTPKDSEVIKLLSEHKKSFLSKYKITLCAAATAGGLIYLLYGAYKS